MASNVRELGINKIESKGKIENLNKIFSDVNKPGFPTYFAKKNQNMVFLPVDFACYNNFAL